MKKILLIEDNPEMRENTAEMLELASYEVLTAANGKEGIEKAQKEIPDLIICDIMMPELDGFGVLHVLNKFPKTSGIPFIFLTAKADRSDMRKGMNMGADDYITKPFDDMELLDAVDIRLRRSERLKSEFSKDIDGLHSFLNEARGIDELSKLSSERKPRKYKKKEMIFHEGDFPTGIYFIHQGKVKTYKTNEEGKDYITGLHKAGDYIGYMAIFEDAAFSESAMAMEDVELYIIPKKEFNALIYRNRDVSSKFIKILSDNLVEVEERMLKLAYNSVRKRVAEALIMLRDRYKTAKDNPFSISISREDLAGIVGTSTESVIRTLSDFKDEGLIQIQASKIILLEEERIENVRN